MSIVVMKPDVDIDALIEAVKKNPLLETSKENPQIRLSVRY